MKSPPPSRKYAMVVMAIVVVYSYTGIQYVITDCVISMMDILFGPYSKERESGIRLL